MSALEGGCGVLRLCCALHCPLWHASAHTHLAINRDVTVPFLLNPGQMSHIADLGAPRSRGQVCHLCPQKLSIQGGHDGEGGCV